MMLSFVAQVRARRGETRTRPECLFFYLITDYPQPLTVWYITGTYGCFDFRLDQGAAVYLVPCHVPPHPGQGRHLQHRVGAPARRHPDDGLEDQAQAHAGDDGAGRHKAPDRTDRDRRRLSRRRAERRQAWPWFAWQDADRGRGRNDTARQANPLEVAPRETASAMPKSRPWRSTISIPPALSSVMGSAASPVSATPAASISRSSLDPVARPH